MATNPAARLLHLEFSQLCAQSLFFARHSAAAEKDISHVSTDWVIVDLPEVRKQ